MKKWDAIVEELKEHLPVTLSLSLIAGVLVISAFVFGLVSNKLILNGFEIAHPVHVLVSAIATTAIFKKYHGNFISALIIGTVGSILIGTLSDVLLPWVAGNVFLLNTTLHLPIIESPFLIFGSAIFGSLFGIYFGMFKFSHFFHIFISVFASLFYLMGFSSSVGVWAIFGYSLIVFFCVYIPCCFSDIVFPILFIKKPCKKCGHWH